MSQSHLDHNQLPQNLDHTIIINRAYIKIITNQICAAITPYKMYIAYIPNKNKCTTLKNFYRSSKQDKTPTIILFYNINK